MTKLFASIATLAAFAGGLLAPATLPSVVAFAAAFALLRWFAMRGGGGLLALAGRFLQLPVTYVHEVCHGVAAVMTGGSCAGFSVHRTGSGQCWVQSRPAWAPVVAAAGYLGVLAFGSALVLSADYPALVSAGTWLMALVTVGSLFKAADLLSAAVGIMIGAVALSTQFAGFDFWRVGSRMAGVLFLVFGWADLMSLVSMAIREPSGRTDAHAIARCLSCHRALVAAGFVSAAAGIVYATFQCLPE